MFKQWQDQQFQQIEDEKDALQHWRELLASGKHADMEFRVGDEVIRAHKLVLVTRVPYFDKMFESGMKEATTNIVEIKDVTPEIWMKFLGFVYTGALCLANWNDATALLKLADMYDFSQLKKRCVGWLEDNITMTDVCKTLILAHLSSCSSLRVKCIKFIRQYDCSIERKILAQLLPHPELMLDVIQNIGEDSGF
jgi:speckle-type POZ protein